MTKKRTESNHRNRAVVTRSFNLSLSPTLAEALDTASTKYMVPQKHLIQRLLETWAAMPEKDRMDAVYGLTNDE